MSETKIGYFLIEDENDPDLMNKLFKSGNFIITEGGFVKINDRVITYEDFKKYKETEGKT